MDARTGRDMSHEGPSDLSLLEAFHRVPDVFWLFRLQCLLRICVWRNHRVTVWRWVSFHARPYRFSFALIIYIVMLTIFGAALVKITQFLLITLLAKPKPAPPSPPLPSHE
jgi:hypothetical protein